MVNINVFYEGLFNTNPLIEDTKLFIYDYYITIDYFYTIK